MCVPVCACILERSNSARKLIQIFWAQNFLDPKHEGWRKKWMFNGEADCKGGKVPPPPSLTISILLNGEVAKRLILYVIFCHCPSEHLLSICNFTFSLGLFVTHFLFSKKNYHDFFLMCDKTGRVNKLNCK